MKQGIYELSATPKYPIGKRIAMDERAFRYTRIATLATVMGRAAISYIDDQEQALAPEDVAIGSNLVPITVQSATGLVANELQGGYLCHPNWNRHRIRSHPAAASGATCVLTLETSIFTAITNGVHTLIAYHNPWYNVGGRPVPGEGWQAFVGMPFTTIDPGQYTWLQTWGPCSALGAILFGVDANTRKVYFNSDGSLTSPAPTADTSCYQIAGFWLPNNYYGLANHPMLEHGHLFFMQITP